MSELYVPPKPPLSFVKGGKFFYGANTGSGFKEYYSHFVNQNECNRIYNVIGGPGTGKSTLLKKIAEECHKNGCECEYYFCSSDPTSLDCIRIFSESSGKTVAVCDATAPHERSFSTPGAVSEIVDLSKFWDSAFLEKKKQVIIKLQESKSLHYLNAYKYIRLLNKANDAIENEIKNYIRNERLEFLILDLIGPLRKPSGLGSVYIRPTGSLSMKGEIFLDNTSFQQKKRYVIQDVLGSSAVVMKEIFKKLSEKQMTLFASPSCEIMGGYNELCFLQKKMIISSIPKDDYDIITTKELLFKNISKKTRSIIASLQKTVKKAKACALYELSLAKEQHFALEEIYGASMNFKSKDEYDAEIVNNISHYLK